MGLDLSLLLPMDIQEKIVSYDIDFGTFVKNSPEEACITFTDILLCCFSIKYQ